MSDTTFRKRRRTLEKYLTAIRPVEFVRPLFALLAIEMSCLPHTTNGAFEDL